jgi:hypothetical protein
MAAEWQVVRIREEGATVVAFAPRCSKLRKGWGGIKEGEGDLFDNEVAIVKAGSVSHSAFSLSPDSV